MNLNTEYEKFTQEIYQKLINADWGKIKKIDVKHDIKLKGRSGQEHQIDVYWEYEFAGITHKVAIECKNYKKPIPIGKVRDFYGVLSDLNDVSGIMVTKNGYQEGAKKYAKYNGINLKELRPPKEEEGIIAQIDIQILGTINRPIYIVDKEWLNTQRNLFLDNYHLIGLPDPNIRDSKNQVLISIEELRDKQPDEIRNGCNKIFKFDNGFVRSPYGLIKINEVEFHEEKINQTTNISLDASNFIQAIIKDALNGKIQRIGIL